MSLNTESDHTIRMDEMRSRYGYTEANVEQRKESEMEEYKRNKARKDRDSRSKSKHIIPCHPINF